MGQEESTMGQPMGCRKPTDNNFYAKGCRRMGNGDQFHSYRPRGRDNFCSKLTRRRGRGGDKEGTREDDKGTEGEIEGEEASSTVDEEVADPNKKDT